MLRRRNTRSPAPIVVTQNAERHPKLLNTMRDELWLLDEETLQLRFLNKAALDRSGLEEGQYRKYTLFDLLNPEKHNKLFNALRAGEDMPTESLLRLREASFEVTLQRFTPPGEKPQVLITLHDISDRIEHEQMKANFVSTVSHELRSPLTSIKGSMGLLLSNAAGELPKSARGLLEIAHRNAERLVLIINDILDLEKIAQGGMEFDYSPVDLSALAREAVEASCVYLQRFDMEVEVLGADRPLEIYTDANRIHQVLTNLLTNAAKFSKPGGKVTLALEDTDVDICISVTDSGVGIPKAEQHKIFQRFADMSNSDRSTKGGTGLGLSICKAIVESLNGTIGFRSVEGCGSTFYFSLPKQEIIEQPSGAAIEMRQAG
ncbi:HAMP domain-containing sensor histidine kinase [Sulfitobacter sp. HNIBRBA3233]|uniref:sensor histidine kinase n=1 Tax=Sulfitobacter marinivivus TaxID=3158558 RepID=UPI0032DF3815